MAPIAAESEWLASRPAVALSLLFCISPQHPKATQTGVRDCPAEQLYHVIIINSKTNTLASGTTMSTRPHQHPTLWYGKHLLTNQRYQACLTLSTAITSSKNSVEWETCDISAIPTLPQQYQHQQPAAKAVRNWSLWYTSYTIASQHQHHNQQRKQCGMGDLRYQLEQHCLSSISSSNNQQ